MVKEKTGRVGPKMSRVRCVTFGEVRVGVWCDRTWRFPEGQRFRPRVGARRETWRDGVTYDNR